MRPADAAEPAEPEQVAVLEPEEDFEQFLLPLLSELRAGRARGGRARAKLWAADALLVHVQAQGEAALGGPREQPGEQREVARMAEMLVQLVRRLERGESA